jgi:hypothetical protein
MKLKTLLVGFLLSTVSTSIEGLADLKTATQNDIDDGEDMLRDFINSKRKIPLKAKANNLKISGDLSVEWAYQNERLNGDVLRTFTYQQPEAQSSGGFVEVDGNRVVIGWHYPRLKFDLYVDWDYKNMWVRTDIRFDNGMGVDDNEWNQKIDPGGYHGSGKREGLNLKQAYIGYELYKCGGHRFIIELGRRGNLYKVFESEIAFDSRLDGIFLEYSSDMGKKGSWYAQCAGFVVDSLANQFSWAAEVGLERILGSGFDLAYTFVDWHKRGKNRYFEPNPQGFRFKVSQWRINWYRDNFLGKGMSLKLYGAFLMNHIPSKVTNVDRFPFDAKRYEAILKRIGRQNTGGYAGIKYGDIIHEGDWYVSGMAAYLEAQCIPDNDVRCIGTGNALKESFTAFGRGNTNWKGYTMRGGYALTENFVIQTQYDRSWAIDASIAGSRNYTRWLVETTYSF